MAVCESIESDEASNRLPKTLKKDHQAHMGSVARVDETLTADPEQNSEPQTQMYM